MKKTNWTDEEKEYLEEKYGEMSIPAIAEKLGRSVDAITVMKTRLNLGAFLQCGDYVSLNQVHRAIYQRNISSSTRSIWVKNGLFVTRKRVNQCKFPVVTIQSFWKWAERHKGLINFRLFEKNTLGEEPVWVDIKRRYDALTRPHNAPWTAAEDNQLRIMAGRKTYPEMAEALSRTSAAIKRRLSDLGISGGPQRMAPRRWTDEETGTLMELYDSGLSYDKIGKKLGRSGGSVSSRLERMINPAYQAEYRRRQRHGDCAITDWAPAGRHGYGKGAKGSNVLTK